MTLAQSFVVAGLVFLGLAVVLGAVLFALGGKALREDEAKNPVLPPEPPKPEPPQPTVTVHLVSAKLRPLDTVKISQSRRRPVLTHRTRDGLLSVFVMHGRSKVSGEWTYRRVGVERES